ncbi:MAG TPA: septum formation initiator family protein [Dehalococcoidia bacterium]
MSRLPHLPLLPLVAGISLIAIAFLGFTTARYVVHNYQLHQDERQLQQELRDLDRDHQQLAATRDYLKSDEYIEYVARRTLGLLRPGETLVVVGGNTPVATPTPAATVAATAWWKQLFASPEAAPTPVPPFTGR